MIASLSNDCEHFRISLRLLFFLPHVESSSSCSLAAFYHLIGIYRLGKYILVEGLRVGSCNTEGRMVALAVSSA